MDGECKLTRLEEDVLKDIEPKPLERRIARRYETLVLEALRGHERLASETVSLEVHGSYAKDTWLSGDFDLDVFIVFPRDKTPEWVRRQGFPLTLQALEKAGIPYTIDYAEHPYATTVYLGLEANIVPTIEPGGERLSVYRTIHHTRYVERMLAEGQRGHVRLLKSFLKAIDAYGADSRVKGFSGYLAELLIIAYKCYPRAVRSIAGWRPPLHVDIEEGRETRLPGKNETPLHIPDPVDPDRNAAAAVSWETLARVVLAAKAYLRRPCRAFYHAYPAAAPRTRPPPERGALIVYHNPTLETLPRDTVWGELNRIKRSVTRLLENHGYTVVYASAYTDESTTAVIGVEVYQERPDPLPRRGPPPWTGDPLRFIEKTLGETPHYWIGPGPALWAWRRRKTTLHGLLEDRWRDYTVPPHFRGVKPLVYRWGQHPPGLEALVARIEERSPRWMACLEKGRDG